MTTIVHAGGTRAAMTAANREPMLEAAEEADLVRRWREQGERRAFDRLVRSHMRLAVKVAAKYARSGLDPDDLVSEAYQGLVQGVRNFDPARGARLGAYVLWWIRAAVQDFTQRNLSAVSGGNSKGLRRVYSNLHRTKASLGIVASPMADAEAAAVAAALEATVEQVREVETRYSFSPVPLDAPMAGRDGEAPTVLDTIADDSEPVDERLAREDEERARMTSLRAALAALEPRERAILASRRLRPDPETLEVLSARHGVSKERVRQIEGRAVQKLRHLIRSPFARLPEPVAA